jgi:hypothetical protein
MQVNLSSIVVKNNSFKKQYLQNLNIKFSIINIEFDNEFIFNYDSPKFIIKN